MRRRARRGSTGTPLRWLTGLNQLINYSRLIGLFAFFYGFLHFFTYFFLDHQFDFAGMWEDVRLRPYITAGFTAFVLMIPLALTSTTGWIRRLGGRNWNLLHKLIYITAMAAVLHDYYAAIIETTRLAERGNALRNRCQETRSGTRVARVAAPDDEVTDRAEGHRDGGRRATCGRARCRCHGS